MAAKDAPHPMTITMPEWLRHRLGAVAKRRHTTIAQIARDLFEREVETYEAKFRAEDEAEERAREARQRKTAARGGGSVSGAVLESKLPSLPDMVPHASISLSERERLDRLRTYYEETATGVLTAGDDAAEVKRLIGVLVGKVRRELPLTHPPENEIVVRLEREMIRQRDEGPAEVRTLDSLVERVVAGAAGAAARDADSARGRKPARARPDNGESASASTDTDADAEAAAAEIPPEPDTLVSDLFTLSR